MPSDKCQVPSVRSIYLQQRSDGGGAAYRIANCDGDGDGVGAVWAGNRCERARELSET